MCIKCDYIFNSDNAQQFKSFALPGSKPHYSPDKQVQVKHIFLDLKFDIPNKNFDGTAHIHAEPILSKIGSLTLNAVDMDIKDVKIDGLAFTWDYDSSEINIYFTENQAFDREFVIKVTYSVSNPKNGIYFVQPNKHYPNKPTQVWTQGESEDSGYWFPCFDYTGQLTTSEIRATVPTKFKVISNGALQSDIDNADGTRTVHWLHDLKHPSYLVALVVGDFFEIKAGEFNGKPITFYAEKGFEQEVQITAGDTPKMVEFLSQKFNYPYPYAKYAQLWVDDYIFGGMENTSCTIITDRGLVDQKAAQDFEFAEAVVIHELAHQWFGDLIVAKHWSHAWLKEGAVSYIEAVWWDHKYGKDAGAYYRLNDSRNYFDEDSGRYRRPMVTHVYKNATELYDRHMYEKGSWVYHMIRAILGDDLFWKTISTFLHDNAHGTVESTDLLRAVEKASGKNLLSLFDQYVYRGGHPCFKLGFNWDGNKKVAKFTVNQTQATSDQDLEHLFDLVIPVTFGWVNQDAIAEQKTFDLHLNQKEQSFYFHLDSKPAFISFDQGNNFLKSVELEYAMPELKNQLKYDPDVCGRILAAETLAKKGGLEAVKALGESLSKDPFWGVRSEVAANLVKIKLDQVYEVLLPGLNDSDPTVRRTVIESLSEIKTEQCFEVLLNAAKSDNSSYFVEAALNRALGVLAGSGMLPESTITQTLEVLQQTLHTKAGWNEVARSGAIAGLAQLKENQQSLDLVLEYTKLGVSEALRRSAIRALGPISKGQPDHKINQIVTVLAEIAREDNFLTQTAVVSALGQIKSRRVIGVLQDLQNQAVDARIIRSAEETIRSVAKNLGNDEAVKQLRTELDQVKKTSQELKSRLEDLEMRGK